MHPILRHRRNLEILEQRLSGRTLLDIATGYGLTRERVRQVCNFTLNKLDPAEKARAEGLMAVNLRSGIERHLVETRQQVARELRNLFKTEFSREKILDIINDKDFSGTDLELCAYLHGKYKIKNFYLWRRCWRCKEIKEVKKAGTCTSCNTIRHNETLARNPHIAKRAIEAQKLKPNHMKIYELRSLLRKAGRLDEMPPLPPKGTPDWKVKIPKISFRKSVELCGADYRRDNMAKKLVMQEARTRGVDVKL